VTAAATPDRDDLPSLELPPIRDLAGLGRRWVVWQYEIRDGKRTKVPLQPDGSRASSTAPSTWSTYQDCAGAYVRGLGDGLGIVLSGDGLVGVDLDHSVGADGSVAPWAAEIVAALDSYTEVSPSGAGLRVFVRGELPAGRRKRGDIEMYETARYLTVTGRHLGGTPERIAERHGALARVHAAHLGGAASPRAAGFTVATWDGALPARVAIARAQDPTVRLILAQTHGRLGYASESEADYALACTLAEAGFEAREIEAALRWRHRHTAPRPKSLDYFARTAANAIAATSTRRRGTR